MSENKNNSYLKLVPITTALIVVIMIVLYFIPEKITEKYNLRRIDIFSDIRKDTVNNTNNVVDSISKEPQSVKIEALRCKDSLVCFEDYSGNKNGMAHFYKALSNVKNGKTVRIAFFGDSYIEGDIFTGDLRAFLQEEFGAGGIGFVDATSITAGFRQTVKHSFGGWNNYSLSDSKKDLNKMGIAGTYHTPGSNAWIKISGVKKPDLDTFKTAKIYYSGNQKTPITYKLNNKKDVFNAVLEPSESVNYFEIKTENDSIGELQINFASSDANIYGVSVENGSGILLDNFSLRGTPGTALQVIPEKNLKEFNKLLQYDLIVLQYGLNVMNVKQTKYTNYKQNMVKVIEHIKECFPNSSILLLSVGDRSMRKDGTYVTMPCVEPMVNTQREMCEETGIVFWNLYQAMGGSGSMAAFVKAKPAKANKDYTHLNFEGGKYLGGLLYETILFERERYKIK